MSTSKKNSRGKNSRRTRSRNGPIRQARNRSAAGGHLHLYSRVETTLTLKSQPNKREVYPLPLSTLFNEGSIGADTDIRMVGYNLDLVVASGNNCTTVSANISHSGPWVRASTSMDGFNQQFRVRPLSRSGKVKFSKRVLPRSEREFLSPHTDPLNFVNLQIDDPCGVIPGATIRIMCSFHFIRPHIPTKLVGAAEKAADLYEDQDVSSTGGGQPAPPSSLADIPAIIYRQVVVQTNIGNEDILTTTDTASPFTYRGSESKTVTITVQGKVNKVGQFTINQTQSPSQIQDEYTKEGYEGQIVLK